MIDIFISLPFEDQFTVVSNIISVVAGELNLNAYRVDQARLAESIPQSILKMIRECKIFVADITGNNPNVLNEIGQAQVLGKPLILISQHKPETAPFNIRSLYIKEYAASNINDLRTFLRESFKQATSPNEILRSMLVPSSLERSNNDTKFIIASSPLAFRRVMKRIGGHKKPSTFSDYVGIRGILQAFGLLFGVDTLPDLVDPDDYDDEAIRENMNIYCIASPKANRWTYELLKEYHKQWVPKLEFKADPESAYLQNVQVSLYADGILVKPPGYDLISPGDRYTRDFGIIIRGPNPYNRKNMIAIIAGRSSLGTEAAAIAFTDAKVIEIIQSQLKGLNIDLENHMQPFWVLVSMERNTMDGRAEAMRNTLKVAQVSRFQ